MARGRRQEPAQSKVIKGNFRPDRHSHGTRVEAKAPKCPVWLPKAAKRHWKETAPLLEQCGLIGVVDGIAFALHCDSAGKYREVTAKLATLGDMIDETPHGYQVQSVLFTIRNKLWEQALKSAQEFGLTPAARSKVKDAGQQQLPFGGDGWDNV